MPTTPHPFRITVLGTGLMGRGIAELLHEVGHAITVWDANAESAENLRGTYDDITVAATPEDAARDAEIIIESVIEDLDIKLDLFRRISAINDTAIIASNTSSLSASVLGAAVAHPARFAIAHFFNPPRLVPLVELVPTSETDHATLDLLYVVLRDAGRMPVMLQREVPGFVANRLQAALLREAFALEHEGVASFADIDLVVRAALAARWNAGGPFMVSDLGGLDVWTKVTTELFPLLSADTEPPAALTTRVAAGELGSKTGSGIYHHTPQGDDAVRQRIREHFAIEFGD